MDTLTLLGFAAATAVNIAFLPQFIKSWQTKKTDDISLPMYIIYTSGIFMWLIYGILSNQIAIIFSESIGILFVIPVLYLKIRYG